MRSAEMLLVLRLFAIAAFCLPLSAQATHLDGAVVHYDPFTVELDANFGSVSSLPGVYQDGNFWRASGGQAAAEWLDAVEPRPDDHIYVRFDLLLIGDWLGENDVNPDLDSRLIIEHAGNVIFDESFANTSVFSFVQQSYGGVDGELAAPGTGALLFIEPELSVYRLAFDLPKNPHTPSADFIMSWRSTRGGNPGLLEFGIDNLVVSSIPLDQDVDGDGVPDFDDNCVNAANPAQYDSNGDNIGNACDADLDNDCTVSSVDLGMVKAVFFSTDSDADFNNDGVVNGIDLGVMKRDFFGAPGPSGLANDCEFWRGAEDSRTHVHEH